MLFAKQKATLICAAGATSLGEAHIICRRQHHYGVAVHHLRRRRNIIGRSPYFALGYACNDVVLVVLWVLASFSEPRYISVAVCFAAFLANDLYGFASWQKMKKRQGAA